MKNIEKYYDDWFDNNSCFDIMCYIHNKRTGNNSECDGNCKECYVANAEWMIAEYKEPILTDQEKEIIRNIVSLAESFNRTVKYVRKFDRVLNGYVQVYFTDSYGDEDVICTPYFDLGKYFNGMKAGKEYTLEELGL